MTERSVDKQEFKYFDLVAMFFVAVLLISNIAAQKLFAFGPFTFTAGVLVFPISYIFGDVLTEVYGFARSRRVIWMGFACNIFMVVVIATAIWLPPAEGWPLQKEFESVLGFVPRIVAASMLAYWVGEFSNSYVLAKMKVRSKGKHLWMRTIGSTIVGQGVDTVIFVLVAFWGVLPWSVMSAAIVSGYLFKVLYEVVITPVTYVMVRELKKREGVDVYDQATNFNPFRLRVD